MEWLIEKFVDFRWKVSFHICPQSQLEDTFVIKRHVDQINDEAVSIAQQIRTIFSITKSTISC